jgi:hypothetical protein
VGWTGRWFTLKLAYLGSSFGCDSICPSTVRDERTFASIGRAKRPVTCPLAEIGLGAGIQPKELHFCY